VTAAREVREKFRNLQKVGVVRYYPETLGIDVSEVFLRGVKRKRPANSEGEELRDVIIWLIALQYAEVEKKSVALVTADGGFWDDTGIHEHLKEDIDQRKVNVSLFRSIDDFIKSSAPQPIPVDEAYILKFFDVTSVGDQILAAAKKQISTSKRLLWQSFTVQSIKSMSLRFSKGNVYDIDADTKFAELTYDVLVVAEFAFTEQQVFSPIFGSGGLGVSFGGIASPLGMLPPLSIVDQQRELLSVLNRPRPSQEASRLNRVVKRYNILVKAQISIRLVKDTLTENELDGIEIDKVEEMAEAG
jgi:hypothetical protein